MMKKLFPVFIVFALASLAVAEGTRQWKETGYDEFEKGTARGIAIRSTGQIELALAFKVIYTSPSTFIWSIAAEKNGQGAVFFKSDEAHMRVLAFDPKGNLIAGSDGSGLVYRISPAGEGFVLYSAPKKEITALAVDSAGNIYAAGTGEKRSIQPS